MSLTVTESLEVRWGLICKVYAITVVQLLLTVLVGRLLDKIYFRYDYAWCFGMTWLIVPFVSKLFVLMFSLNRVLFVIFTVSVGLVTALTCSFTHELILEAVNLTALEVVSLSWLTFWATKRGYDFNFLGPFLFGAIMVLMVFSLILLFFPLDMIILGMIYQILAAITFCGYIVYDTDKLIKGYTYDGCLQLKLN